MEADDLKASRERMRALLVDPSLFTAPYDAALTQGLLSAGVNPLWAVRPTRPGDRQEIPENYVDAFFYRTVDRVSFLPQRLRSLLKGVAHARGLAQLLLRVRQERPDVVHFQWIVVPALDALALWCIKQSCPVLLTVHDTIPFNGDRLSPVQNVAFDLPLKLADAIVVHTQGARRTLNRRGIPSNKLFVIPHGPLELPHSVGVIERDVQRRGRFTFLLFGELKPYKGVDLLVEAAARLPTAVRAAARFIVAGRPRMNLEPIRHRIAELGLADTLELRAYRLPESEMVELFAETDCFVFPYRQIDASGVYFLTKGLGKWLIASRVGVFAEEVEQGVQGDLIPPDDVAALTRALERAIIERATPTAGSARDSASWVSIGAMTREVYTREVARRATADSKADGQQLRVGRRSTRANHTPLGKTPR